MVKDKYKHNRGVVHLAALATFGVIGFLAFSTILLPQIQTNIATSRAATQERIITINPLEDTYVSSATASQNFGSTDKLISGENNKYTTYIKVDISSLAGKNLSSAAFKLKVADASSATHEIKLVGSSNWSETTMTYSNRSTVGATVASFTPSQIGNWTTVDLSQFIPAVVSGQVKVVSFAITSSSADPFSMYSKDSPDKPYFEFKENVEVASTPVPTVPTTATPKATPVQTTSSGATPTPTPASAGGAQQNGLTGQYFNNSDFTNQVTTRIDPQINFNWFLGAPASSMGVDTFSIRWDGFIRPAETSDYTFYLFSDDGVRLWIDNKLVAQDWSNHSAREVKGAIRLEGGRSYPIKIDYYDNSGRAQIRLSWSSAKFAKKVVESTFLTTTSPSIPLPPAGAVPSSTSSPRPTATQATAPSATPTTMPGSGTTGGNSHAMGTWSPSKWDTCTKDEHDSYYVVGPDGKKYPTWHAPTHKRANGTICTFGHEHGTDPKQSPFWSKIQQQYGYDANKNGSVDGSELSTAGLPFGYVNEVYLEYNASIGKPTLMRHEDHVGHKLDWTTNVSVDYTPTNQAVGGSARRPTGLTCDYLTKAHQGTHSKDAFSNNLHEVITFIHCSDGHDLRLAKLVQFGRPGEFTRFCDVNGVRNTATVKTGFSNTSPDYPGVSDHEGARTIIDRACVEQVMLVPGGKFSGNFYEAWPFNMNLTKKDGSSLTTTIDMLLDVEDAVRYYYPGRPNDLGYAMDLCYEVEPNGDRWRGGMCDQITNYGQVQNITWDDPRSGFQGLHRGFYFKPGSVFNANGPTTWYTDPYGKNGQTTPFPGAVKQYIISRSVNYGQKFGGIIEPSVLDREHAGTGVHAPN